MRRFWPGLAAVGLFAGVVLEFATFLVARYGPVGGEGASWSFRGNGALVVPFGFGPAVLAGGWTGVVLHYRGVRHSLRGGVLAGVVGAVVALADALSVTLPGEAGMFGIQALSLMLLAWTMVAPVLAGAWRARSDGMGENHAEITEHLVAGVALPLGLVLGFVLASGVLPPGS